MKRAECRAECRTNHQERGLLSNYFPLQDQWLHGPLTTSYYRALCNVSCPSYHCSETCQVRVDLLGKQQPVPSLFFLRNIQAHS